MVSEITFAAIVGVMTIVVGVTVKLLGFPDQFRLNYKRKSTKGVSTIFYVLGFLSYSLWTLHGFLQGDWVLVVGQGIGVLTTAAIVYQIVLYKNRGIE